jgi:hypothetical protein
MDFMRQTWAEVIVADPPVAKNSTAVAGAVQRRRRTEVELRP